MIRCEIFDERCAERYGDIRTDHVPRAGDVLWFADGALYRVIEVRFMIGSPQSHVPAVETVRLLCAFVPKGATTP